MTATAATTNKSTRKPPNIRATLPRLLLVPEVVSIFQNSSHTTAMVHFSSLRRSLITNCLLYVESPFVCISGNPERGTENRFAWPTRTCIAGDVVITRGWPKLFFGCYQSVSICYPKVSSRSWLHRRPSPST